MNVCAGTRSDIIQTNLAEHEKIQKMYAIF